MLEVVSTMAEKYPEALLTKHLKQREIINFYFGE